MLGKLKREETKTGRLWDGSEIRMHFSREIRLGVARPKSGVDYVRSIARTPSLAILQKIGGDNPAVKQRQDI